MPAWTTLELTDPDGPVATLALNRPDQHNAINAALAQELVDCLSHLATRRGLRALVLTGKGRSFCAGGDLSERLQRGPGHARLQRDTLLQALDLMQALPCPVIAMVQGAALAGGLELALGCDLRIASEAASFGLPEARSAGGFPGGGGPYRLARMVGRGRAGLVVFSARRFSAREAFELGFVEQVVPPDQLQACVGALARDIAANSPSAIRAAKQLLVRSGDLDAADATALSRRLRDPQDESPDFEEAMRAWQERRAPRYGDRDD